MISDNFFTISLCVLLIYYGSTNDCVTAYPSCECMEYGCMDTQSEYAVTSHLLYDTDHATYVHTLRTVRELDGYY